MNVKKIAFQVVSKQPLQKWGKIEMAFTNGVLLSLLIWLIGLDCMVHCKYFSRNISGFYACVIIGCIMFVVFTTIS